MKTNSSIIHLASLIGDPTRAAMLDALMSGKALPAGELAFIADVTPQTASSHLAKLEEGNLVQVEKHGRHRYYRLASVDVAELMELLSRIAPPVAVRSLRQSEQLRKIRDARTCYDHLAGRLGVALTNAFLEREFLTNVSDREFGLTPEGIGHLREWGIDIGNVKSGRRVFAKRCLDWSERIHHIGGLLGALMTERLFANGWMVRVGDTRAVRLSAAGEAKFKLWYNIDW